MTPEYESELTASRDDVVRALERVADGIAAGSIRLDTGEETLVADVPDELTLEVEFETDDEESQVELELEIEWPVEGLERGDVSDAPADERADDPGESDADVRLGAGDGSAAMARFEVFRDRGGEWRWRLRHLNGNVIAASGEGYTRKRNAIKGLRSVVENAPGADVTEESEARD